MTTNPINFPVSVDYTSRDFYSIRDALITRIQNNVNIPGTGVSWSGTDPSDFGVALVEAIAYMGDSINYYIDRMANETYITTAAQRQSLINIAKSYGYSVSGYRNSNLDVVFYNSSTSAVTVPKSTQLSAEVTYNDVVTEVVFTLEEDVLVPAQVDGVPGESEAVSVVSGEWVSSRVDNDAAYGEPLGVSDGLPSQAFYLSENQVVDTSVVVYVETDGADNYEKWDRVTHFADAKPTDAVYTVDIDANNYVTISFGDGVSGAIPNFGATIKADFYVGGGQVSNVAAGLVNNIKKVPFGYNLSDIEVVNTTAGTGGSDPESDGSIRRNAPKALSALNRAVTLEDYANLVLGVANVGKANAVAESKNSITVYVSPQQDVTSTDQYPGYSGDPDDGGVLTSAWLSLQLSAEDFLATRRQIGVSVTVSPPSYVPVVASIKYTKLPQYSNTQVATNIVSELVTRFSYNYINFEDVITPEEVEYQLRQVEGVYNVKVTGLSRSGSTGRNTLLGGAGELFVFSEANSFVTAYETDATITDLTSNVGTLSPAFSSGVFNYNLPVPNGTTEVELTVTKDNAAISVNGIAATSEVPATVSTPVGTTIIPINITAEDGISTQAYRVTVTRTA